MLKQIKYKISSFSTSSRISHPKIRSSEIHFSFVFLFCFFFNLCPVQPSLNLKTFSSRLFSELFGPCMKPNTSHWIPPALPNLNTDNCHKQRKPTGRGSGYRVIGCVGPGRVAFILWERWLGHCCEAFTPNWWQTTANTTACQARATGWHCYAKGEYLAGLKLWPSQAEKMLLLWFKWCPLAPIPTHLQPFAIIMYCCPLLRAHGCGAPEVSVWEGGETRAGGLFTSEEAVTIDGKPPAAAGSPKGPHNTNISGDVFLHGVRVRRREREWGGEDVGS